MSPASQNNEIDETCQQNIWSKQTVVHMVAKLINIPVESIHTSQKFPPTHIPDLCRQKLTTTTRVSEKQNNNFEY